MQVRGRLGAAAAVAVLLAAMLEAQPPTQTPAQPAGQPPIRGQMPELGRPTQESDQVPLFNFDDYFLGTWTFEWLVPESPLGPAGEITGTTTYRAIGGRFYRAETKARGPEGAFGIIERLAYHKENRTIARWVADSRGFSYMQVAAVGGDLGGFYNVHFESEPFTVKGRTIRVRDSLRLVSPVNYRVSTTIAVDAGRFTNFGNPWFRKN